MRVRVRVRVQPVLHTCGLLHTRTLLIPVFPGIPETGWCTWFKFCITTQGPGKSHKTVSGGTTHVSPTTHMHRISMVIQRHTTHYPGDTGLDSPQRLLTYIWTVRSFRETRRRENSCELDVSLTRWTVWFFRETRRRENSCELDVSLTQWTVWFFHETRRRENSCELDVSLTQWTVWFFRETRRRENSCELDVSLTQWTVWFFRETRRRENSCELDVSLTRWTVLFFRETRRRENSCELDVSLTRWTVWFFRETRRRENSCELDVVELGEERTAVRELEFQSNKLIHNSAFTSRR